jgi:hypothetical protein
MIFLLYPFPSLSLSLSLSLSVSVSVSLSLTHSLTSYLITDILARKCEVLSSLFCSPFSLSLIPSFSLSLLSPSLSFPSLSLFISISLHCFLSLSLIPFFFSVTILFDSYSIAVGVMKFPLRNC